jgi:hypothetical protein
MKSVAGISNASRSSEIVTGGYLFKISSLLELIAKSHISMEKLDFENLHKRKV